MASQENIIRNIEIMQNGEIDIFLGAGASIGSGIPTGRDMVRLFKRKIYCTENKVSEKKFKDVKLPSNQELFQNYFDSQGEYPPLYDPTEYSFYFEKCYDNDLARQRFIEQHVVRYNPSIGYLCLAEMIIQGKIKNIWTTNFDSLPETAINILKPQQELLVCSSVNSDSITNFNPNYPCICKLHGDFRYGKLQNTSEELRGIECKLQEYWLKCLQNRGMVVMGYSGNDKSVMNFLEQHISESAFLSKGLYWMTIRGVSVNSEVEKLIEKAKQHNKIAEIIEFDSFDDFFQNLYKSLGYKNSVIDEQWKNKINKKICFNKQSDINFIKLNAFMANEYPKCNVFETDITSWKQLKNIIKGKDVICALYNKHIYAFCEAEKLSVLFQGHVKSKIELQDFDEKILNKYDSIYIGMIYSLIKCSVTSRSLIEYRKNKYYDPASKTIDKQIVVYDAVEVAVECMDDVLYLFLLPTVHVVDISGRSLSQEVYKYQTNRKISSMYNRTYNDKLKKWQLYFKTNSELRFSIDGFSISFDAIALSAGGADRKTEWKEIKSYVYDEPEMCFSDTDESKRCICQIKGLIKNGPIDFSYDKKETSRPPIQLAVLSPCNGVNDILTHLNGLNSRHAQKNIKEMYIPNYEGFLSVYKRALLVPDITNKELCITYNESKIINEHPQKFSNFLKRGIDHFSLKVMDFDVLVIYIPKRFVKFREAKEISEDFNLHDAIKLYATEKGVSIQFVEERSLKQQDKCKVAWGLSTSIYAKAHGVLWHPKAISDGTAYIGIGYAQSKEKGTCIGCSQLFDSTGTGIRMILRKIDNPLYYSKNNPYMNRDEARKMMLSLREQYYKCCPTEKLTRVVIHKTTPFLREEIIGITQAFEGVEVDLLQIQEYSPWRGIRFDREASKGAHNYSITRGTTMPLNDKSFLLWTHGCVMHPELSNNQNYYKGGRGIPSPLFVKRYYGESDGDTLVDEILMLTKMNWNSGDSLYKVLPVTVDFAKVLSRMSKQNEAIYDKAYDFRYFM